MKRKKKKHIHLQQQIGIWGLCKGKKRIKPLRPLRGDYYGGPKPDDLPQRTEREREKQHSNEGIKGEKRRGESESPEGRLSGSKHRQ